MFVFLQLSQIWLGLVQKEFMQINSPNQLLDRPNRSSGLHSPLQQIYTKQFLNDSASRHFFPFLPHKVQSADFSTVLLPETFMILTSRCHPSNVNGGKLRCCVEMFTWRKPFLCFFNSTINFLMHSWISFRSADKSLKGKKSAVCSSSSCILFAGDEWPCQTDLCVMVTWQCTSMSSCRFVERKPPQAMTVNEKIKHWGFFKEIWAAWWITLRGSLLHNNTFSPTPDLLYSSAEKFCLKKSLEVKLHAEQSGVWERSEEENICLKLIFLLFKILWYFQRLIKATKRKIQPFSKGQNTFWRRIKLCIDFKTERDHISTVFYVKFYLTQKYQQS